MTTTDLNKTPTPSPAPERGRAYILDGRDGSVTKVCVLGESVPAADKASFRSAVETCALLNADEAFPRFLPLAWFAAQRLGVSL